MNEHKLVKSSTLACGLAAALLVIFSGLTNIEAEAASCRGYAKSERAFKKLQALEVENRKGNHAAVAINEKGRGCGYWAGSSSRKGAEKGALYYCNFYAEKYKARKVDCRVAKSN